MRELDHERVGDVACLPPVRRSARDRVLVRMQTLSAEAGTLPELGEPLPGGLTLVVATGLGMSAGKTLAQIGHAALMADLDPDLEVRVGGAERREWDRLAGSAVAIVRDGGLTELTPGSETVLVLEGRYAPPRGREDARVRVLIVNPFASGVSERRLASVQAALPAGTETVLTTARGEATELAAEWSPRAEAIYVFSGDGTYNEVINGLRADVPVGFVPGGGTSVLPRALGLPRDASPCGRANRARGATAHLPRPASTAACSRSTRASASMPSSCAASTRWDAARTASGPATSPSAGPWSGRSSITASATRRRSRSTGWVAPPSR